MRVLKWSVAVDDRPHPIGTGPVVLVGCQYQADSVQVWTLEDADNLVGVPTRQAQVFGTGQRIPEGMPEHVGSTMAETPTLPWVGTTTHGLVWHVFAAPW